MNSPINFRLPLAAMLLFLSGCVMTPTANNAIIQADPQGPVFGLPKGIIRDDDRASAIAGLTGFNVIAMDSEEVPDKVDVIVRQTGVSNTSVEVETYSAHTRKRLTSARVSGWSKATFRRDLAKHLLSMFSSQSELYKQLISEKAAGRMNGTFVAAAPAPAAPSPARSTGSAFESDVETPSFRLAEDETKFAVVIGVENYQTVARAEYAARDARAVKAHLRAAGYPERNIIYLVDQQAGKSALEKYLDAWLPRNTDDKSTVLFYFSGHGAPDTEKGEAYLMPWDADSKFTESTGYPVKRLYAKLNSLKARRVLVAMDACFSGAGPRSVIGKGLRPLVVKVDDGGGFVGRAGVLTASASDEMTGSDETSGHGLFTYHLLKALNARAGKATLKELFDSLSPKVRDAARRDNRDQTPQLIGDARSTF